ncbi:dienelactone hydrolase family protein [Acaryochloris sp. IP29b_bin.148]|uniref:dienelactone hydrolase family protein n=1 Tax=Acaryochloris sp. IP29b_bin.148 TaxID=2969218 RepID=UPI00260693A0|nr:dienelactone hydrolase family protein [Acaryochloris sp. IP29b_bin.148]
MIPIQTDTVTIANGDLQIEAYLAQPQAQEIWPGIIVFQEVFGVNAHIRTVTERIAQLGYVAIAPALYQRQAPGFAVGYTSADLDQGRTYKNQTTAAELLSDIRATLAYLKQKSNVKAAFGTIGFCFGGHVAYLAATLPEIQATASLYGAGIATMTPGGGAATLSLTPQIQGVVYAFFGTQDTLIPLTEVEQVRTALSTHQIHHQIFTYPADHGFFCDQRASYQPEAAAQAWQQIQHLFRQTLVG